VILIVTCLSKWTAEGLLKRSDSISGYGRLLRDHLRHELAEG
jgi:hypothetical protein